MDVRPVGQELASSRNTTIKPVVQLSDSGRAKLSSREQSLEQADLLTSELALGTNEPLATGDEVNTEADTVTENGAAPVGGANDADEDRAEAQERRQEEQELQEIRDLSARDREVRAHEQAHATVGGQYAGAPSYEYQRGPNGVRYAVAGEVPIDVSPEATPEETIQKALIVQRAALAPAEPSAQDRKVAAQAAQLRAQAQQELAAQRREETSSNNETQAAEDEDTAVDTNTLPDSSTNVVNPLISSNTIENAVSSVGSIDSSQSLSSQSFPGSIQSRLSDSLTAANFNNRNPQGSVLNLLV